MKIIAKFTLLYLVLLFLALILGGFITYKSVKQEVKRETDFSLAEETRIVVQSIKDGKPIDALRNAKVEILTLDYETELDPRGVFVDTLMMHRRLNRMEVFRAQSSSHKIDDNIYGITITDVFIEENDMLEGVVSTMVRLFIVLSLLFILFGLLFSRIILRPFQETLGIIDNFNVSNNNTANFPATSTKEFTQLNTFLRKMMGKASADYHSLKEFSENASHEMQTPLAIVKGKLELLQSSQKIEKEDHQLIQSSQNAISKLSNLTGALSLLTKLDNEEFRTIRTIDFSHVLHESLSVYEELAELKGIVVNTTIASNVHLEIDPRLADIFVSNLLKNAIHHNIEDGRLNVELTEDSLIFENTGPAPKSDPNLFFERFKKNNQSGESLGLGLSIVKKIIDLNGWKIRYNYHLGMHVVALTF